MLSQRQIYMEKYKKDHKDVIDAQQKRYRINNKQKRYDDSRQPNIRLSVAKYRAKKRKLEFSISLNDYTRLLKNPCYYCGQITFGFEVGCGLDRINNKKGYILGNVLPCCGDCNTHRQDTWTVEEMKIAIEAIRKFRRQLI